jgi:hypothetical protein
MRDASPRWKTRCANLAQPQKPKEKQCLAVSNASGRKHEHRRNGCGACKTEIAAPTGIGSGDKIEKHASAFEGNSYHNASLAATRAGVWYAENRGKLPGAVIPTLRRTFGLSALKAVQAIREANGGQR